MSDAKSANAAASSNEQRVEEAQELPTVLESTATGNERIAVLRHELLGIAMGRDEDYATARVEVAIRNISDTTIATAVFEALFYDAEGNVIDTVRKNEVELPPETSRAVRIASSIPIDEEDQVRSYQVRLVKATTADVEKVQFRRYEMNTLDTGEEQVWGIVKNISGVKTDAAVLATFRDANNETIATRALVLRELEPNTIRQFDLRFRPQEAGTICSVSLSVGELVG